MKLWVKVSPKAARNAINGWHGDVLKISVTAVPERGKANAAVQRLLAETLGLPLAAVVLRRGQSSAQKCFEITGLDEGELLRRLSATSA